MSVAATAFAAATAWALGDEGSVPFDEVGGPPRIYVPSRGLLAMMCDAARRYFLCEAQQPALCSGFGEERCA